mmetsp:Transcript_44072/g.70784  ORF Transcript_44072/g.70784 Transcript_44072/m.70784 type:complete len:86 (-) Transcript_44072:84-341(-)
MNNKQTQPEKWPAHDSLVTNKPKCTASTWRVQLCQWLTSHAYHVSATDSAPQRPMPAVLNTKIHQARLASNGSQSSCPTRQGIIL